MLIAAARERGLIGDRRWRGARYHTDSRFNSRAIATRTNDGAVFGLGDGSGRPRHRASYTAMPASPMVGRLGAALLSLPISLTAPLRRGFFVYSVHYRTDGPDLGDYKLPGRITIGEFMLLLTAAIAAGAVAGFALAAIMVKAMSEYPTPR
jgi:hypothetical protein